MQKALLSMTAIASLSTLCLADEAAMQAPQIDALTKKVEKLENPTP